MGGKRTSDLIPLCHPLALTDLVVAVTPDRAAGVLRIRAEAATTGPTGVEMEALTAASVAALTSTTWSRASSAASRSAPSGSSRRPAARAASGIARRRRGGRGAGHAPRRPGRSAGGPDRRKGADDRGAQAPGSRDGPRPDGERPAAAGAREDTTGAALADCGSRRSGSRSSARVVAGRASRDRGRRSGDGATRTR